MNEVPQPDAALEQLIDSAETDEEPLRELPSPRSSEPSSAKLMTQVLEAFHGDFERPRISCAYVAALLFVAAFSVLLVLTYVGLVVAAAYGVYWHAVTHTSWLSMPMGIRGRGGAAVVAAYLLPLLFGAVMVVFLLKPLLARTARSRLGRKLELSDEPIVHSFVAKLAEVIGAPPPAEIRINSSVNASASFGSGLRALFSQRLVLTIGTPLVAGLNADQFAGVMAHELGHFSQGLGSRVTGLIGAINLWMSQETARGDEWDEAFEEMTGHEWPLVVLLGLICQLAALFVRGIFWGLQFISRIVTFLLLRQMEFDADRYVAMVVGTETFRLTTRKLGPLTVAESLARHMLMLREAPEPEEGHFAGLVMDIHRTMPLDLKKEIRELGRSTKTSWFSTDPSDSDRIRNVEKLNAPGIFHLDMPAEKLFLNFPRIARQCSPKLFKMMFPGE